MASSWIAGMLSNGIQSAIQPGVASAGSFAGGAVSSVGNGINSVGESFNSYIRRYGTGIQDYGNAIRDWSAAEGPRAQTASNPLGLSSTAAGGKAGVTRPSLPPAMQRSNSSPAAPRKPGPKGQKAIEGGPTKKSPLAGKKPPAPKTTGSTTAGKAPASSTPKSNTGKVRISAASKPQNLNKAKPAKPATGANKPSSAPKQKGVNHLYVGE